MENLLIETLTSYGIVGVWLLVTIFKEWKQTNRLIQSLDRLGDKFELHHAVIVEKIENLKCN